MIVILCESFQDAIDAFSVFVQYLNDTDPRSIVHVFEASNCVETDENLRYIFVDYRCEPIFVHMRPDIVTNEEFFNNLRDIYM